MNIEQRLLNIFPNSFQVNRVAKEIQVLREAKTKMGLEIKYLCRQNMQLVIVVEILRQKLKQIKQLSFLSKLQFKIVLKTTYPTQPPALYFLNQNSIELGIDPFYNYLKRVSPDWIPKQTILDIIKVTPLFVIRTFQKPNELKGEAVLGECFEAERLFLFQGCQVFPVKLLRKNTSFNGVIAIVNGQELIILEQGNFTNTYLTRDYIKIGDIYSVQKHKSIYSRALIELKQNNKKYAIEFSSDQYDTIVDLIVDKLKSLTSLNHTQRDSDQDSNEQIQSEPIIKKKDKGSDELFITNDNIKSVESQITILLSLIETNPFSSNVKQLVQLLKKAVQYYSINGNEQRCQAHLKNLQNIMNNEFMQVLLASEDDCKVSQRTLYQSIAYCV